MKAVRFMLVFIFLFFAAGAQAHPPVKITLTYDAGTKVLHIEVTHVVSYKLHEHHIRKIIVYKNDEQFKELSYAWQKPTGAKEDVIIETVTGDVLRVMAQSTEGGKREESLTIP